MAGHAQLKFVMTECSKTQIRLTGLNLLFVWFVVLWPSQHIKVMSSVVTYPRHTAPGQALLLGRLPKPLTSTKCPYFPQQLTTALLESAAENGHRSYSMTKSFCPQAILTASHEQMSCSMTKQTKWHVRPAKTQIRLGICPVTLASLLSTRRNLRSLATHWAHSEVSDQTGQMPRLIWVFAGCTDHIAGFVVVWLKSSFYPHTRAI